MAELYNSTVIENISLSPSYKLLTFVSSKLKKALPGQFVTIECNSFLRRPFGVSGINNSEIHVLYRVIGRGTRFLAEKKKGDTVNIFGPLGNGFQIQKKLFPVLVAGGTGIASLRYLAQHLKPGILFYGGKKQSDIVGIDIFKKNKWAIRISTEDGTAGYKGLVIGPLVKFIDSYRKSGDLVVYACGPKPMLKVISKITCERNIRCQISLEEILACGVGTCRGCVIKTKITGTDGFKYKTVCKDGPVFNVNDVLL